VSSSAPEPSRKLSSQLSEPVAEDLKQLSKVIVVVQPDARYSISAELYRQQYKSQT
jgi:hypothetical protein